MTPGRLLCVALFLALLCDAARSDACALPGAPVLPYVARLGLAEGPRTVLLFAGDAAARTHTQWPLPRAAAQRAALAAALDPSALSIADAGSGELLWQWTAAGAATVPDAPAAAPPLAARFAPLLNARGELYRLYLGDDRGNLWRLDLPTGVPFELRAQQWQMRRIAWAGELPVEQAQQPWPPSFVDAPDVIYTRGAAGEPLQGVLIAGTARLSEPAAAETPAAEAGAASGSQPTQPLEQSWLFYVRDRASGGAAGAQAAAPLSLWDLPEASTCSKNTQRCREGAGWRFALAVGERAVGPPLSEGGRVFLGAARSIDGFCVEEASQPGADAAVYVLALADASPALPARVGEGLSPESGAYRPLSELAQPQLQQGEIRLLPWPQGAGGDPRDTLYPEPDGAGPTGEQQSLPVFERLGPRWRALYWRDPLADH